MLCGLRLAIAGAVVALTSGAHAAIIATASPGGLDALMGTPLFAVTDDGMPVGSLYGHPPTLTPGASLATPIGPMGFMPTHERLTAGTPFSSGSFLALPIGGPGGIAGSDVVPPLGATAIDFFITAAPGSVHSFEITAVGTLTTATIIVPGVTSATPMYVGFGAFGETLLDISIVKLPFPSTTMTTWIISDIRVLPAPGGAALFTILLAASARRRR